MRNRYLYFALLSFLSIGTESTAQAIFPAPRLVVCITVDQLRTDHLETFAPLYTSDGLKRLMTEGYMFTNASYSFSPIDRASAAASLATGSTPYYNGVTGIEWMDRNTLRPKHILRDDTNKLAPVQLAVSTIGDEMKIATKGIAKVFSFAATAENAILSAGHAADGATWICNGLWETTNYYTPINQWLSGYKRLFAPTEDTNRSITGIAVKCLQQAGIGLDEKTDLLCVNYSTKPDMESYVALDRNIAELIDSVTNKVPIERVLFVLTSTGSTEENYQEITEEAPKKGVRFWGNKLSGKKKETTSATYKNSSSDASQEMFRIPTGTFLMGRNANLLNMYLGAVYGSDQYVETCYHNQVFLNHKLLERKNINIGDILRRSQEFLLQLSGVRNVYTSTQLMTSDSNLMLRIRNGFNIEKCGDLTIDIAPGWNLVNEDTHTSTVSRASYIPFPILFFGANIKAQRIQTPVTVDRIAPTIARIIRIRAPNACSAEPLF